MSERGTNLRLNQYIELSWSTTAFTIQRSGDPLRIHTSAAAPRAENLEMSGIGDNGDSKRQFHLWGIARREKKMRYIKLPIIP